MKKNYIRVASPFLLCFLMAAHLFADDSQIGTIKKAILEFAQQRYPASKLSAEIIAIPDKKFFTETIQVSCRKNGDIAGRTFFTIHFKKPDGLWDTMQVCAVIRRYESVIVLTNDMQKDQIITQRDIAQEIREAIWSQNDMPVLLQEAIGRKAARRLSKGRILTSSMVVALNDIATGQPVSLHVYSKNIQMTLPAVACQPGVAGDQIKVRITSTNAYVQAIVQDKDNVIAQY